MTKEDFEVLKDTLADQRKIYEDANYALLEKRRVFLEDIEKQRKAFEKTVAEEAAKVAELEKIVSQIDQSVRQALLAHYENTGEKTPCPGLGVRVLTRLEYDKKLALEWAKRHNLALALDSKQFESIAPSLNLDFVSETESVTTVISLK